MSIELKMLVWSVVLGLVHMLSTGVITTSQHGVAYGLSSRDEKREVTGIGARVQRAFANFMQSFPFFAAAVLMAQVLDKHNGQTALGAVLYFWSRLAFVLLYAFNVIVVRTLAFAAAVFGIALVLLGLR